MEPVVCPVLIDRSSELEALTAALAAARQGRGGAVFATGDPGVGKSRLVQEISARARAEGFLVLAGRASEAAVPSPFRPITEALLGAAREGISPDLPGVADYRAALGTLVPEWSRPGDTDAEVSPLILGEAMLRVLSVPGYAGGLLVLEDLHRADPETVAILEYLADNVSATRACCLATMRATGPSAAVDLLASLSARRVVTVVEVRRLSDADVTAMTAACLGAGDVPAEIGELLADCEGLPFAVEETLAAAMTSGQLVRSPDGWRIDERVVTGLPLSIVTSVRDRLAGLRDQDRSVIVAAAVLGRQFDWQLLPAVTGLTGPTVMEALRQASILRLIEPADPGTSAFRFRHSLTRDAIVSGLLAPELASRAGRAAAAVEAQHPGLPGSWCDLAAGLLATAGQLDDAAGLQLTVARRALATGAVATSVVALRDARTLLSASEPADPALAIAIDEALCEALAQSGDYEQLGPLAAGLLDRLDMTGPDRRRGALIHLRVAGTRPEDHPATAAAHLAAAGAIASQLGDAELASRAHVAAARNALAGGDLDAACELARASLAAAEQAGLAGWGAEVAVEALEVIGRRQQIRDPAAGRAVLERAHKIATERGLGAWQLRTLHDLASLGMLADGTTSALTDVRSLAADAGLLSIVAIIDLQLASFWGLGTDLDRALAAAQQSEHSARQVAARRVEVHAIALQGVAAAIRGNRTDAEHAARRAERIMPGDPSARLQVAGQIRVLTPLFGDDISRAARLSSGADPLRQQVLRQPRQARGFYSPAQGPVIARGFGWGLHALLQAATGGDIEAAVSVARAGSASRPQPRLPRLRRRRPSRAARRAWPRRRTGSRGRRSAGPVRAMVESSHPQARGGGRAARPVGTAG